MDARLTKLETRLDTLLPMLATKTDVAESKSDIIKWLAGLLFAATAMTITVLSLVINATKAQAPVAQPIIVNVPPQVVTAPAPAPEPKKSK